MVMLLSVQYRKDDFNIRIEAMELMLLVVDGSLEVDTIDTRLHGLGGRQEMLAAAICVGNNVVDDRPDTVRHEGKSDGNALGWTSNRSVENVC